MVAADKEKSGSCQNKANYGEDSPSELTVEHGGNSSAGSNGLSPNVDAQCQESAYEEEDQQVNETGGGQSNHNHHKYRKQNGNRNSDENEMPSNSQSLKFSGVSRSRRSDGRRDGSRSGHADRIGNWI